MPGPDGRQLVASRVGPINRFKIMRVWPAGIAPGIDPSDADPPTGGDQGQRTQAAGRLGLAALTGRQLVALDPLARVQLDQGALQDAEATAAPAGMIADTSSAPRMDVVAVRRTFLISPAK
jgi:hypothetical protein